MATSNNAVHQREKFIKKDKSQGVYQHVCLQIKPIMISYTFPIKVMNLKYFTFQASKGIHIVGVQGEDREIRNEETIQGALNDNNP